MNCQKCGCEMDDMSPACPGCLAEPPLAPAMVRLEDCTECWPEHGARVHLRLSLSTGGKTLCGLRVFDIGRSPARTYRRGSFCKHCECRLLPNAERSDGCTKGPQ